MFEIETYVLDDENLTGWVRKTLHGVRIFCFVLVAHTIFAFAIVVTDLQPSVPVEDVSSLCELVDADVSYVYNLEYTDINDQNCSEISGATEYYWVAKDPVVSDFAGLTLERDLAWADLVEVVLWLFILLAIEKVVRLQGQGITAGKLISTLNTVKVVSYGSLMLLGIYWASLTHWLYLWDTMVWIGGFAAIEMNINEWRDEIDDKADDDLNVEVMT
jgi:hypothetical protein